MIQISILLIHSNYHQHLLHIKRKLIINVLVTQFINALNNYNVLSNNKPQIIFNKAHLGLKCNLNLEFVTLF